MILIGEKLNSSIPKTMELLQNQDEQGLLALITLQAESGADFLDINTAICGEQEREQMLWVVKQVLTHSSCGVMIDTADPRVMRAAAELVHTTDPDRPMILNSTTIDDRFDAVTALVKETGACVVALPINQEGMPHTAEEKCAKIDLLVEKLRAAQISDAQIYVDVLVETIATSADSAQNVLAAIRHVTEKYPNVKTTCGLSNISFGLPRRALINSVFMSAALMAGLSSAILDLTNPSMRDAIVAAKVIAGQDDYCMNYIAYIRGDEE